MANIWIEGTDFKYIDSEGNEKSITGTKEGAEGADPGHIWIEGVNFRYIDSSGDERYFETSAYFEDGFTYTFPFFFSP